MDWVVSRLCSLEDLRYSNMKYVHTWPKQFLILPWDKSDEAPPAVATRLLILMSYFEYNVFSKFVNFTF